MPEYQIKKRKRIKGMLIFALAVNLFFQTGITASAAANYNSYTYNEWDESVRAPESYAAVTAATGFTLGCGKLNKPQDMFIDGNGYVYIADTGNNRIVVADKDLNLVRVIDEISLDGKEEPVTDPQGLYVSKEGILYVAQPSLSRVILLQDNKVISVVTKPEHNLIAEDFVFSPVKIGVDIYGRLYVLSKGCYTGLLQFDKNGKFMDFYGANKVELTPKVLFQYMWKNILTDAQREEMVSILPIEYSNLDCGEDGFVYTTTVGTETPYNQVKKLNPQGNNTYYGLENKEINFGDSEVSYNLGAPVYSSFIDVKVDKDGFLYGLDNTRGRIFERDQEGNLIAVFGGTGNQLGTFLTPIALEAYDGRIYVLDAMKNNVVLFEETEYERLLKEATVKYQQGEYKESIAAWKEVLKRNGNNMLAYRGLGKALAQNKEYKEAMKYLKGGGDRYDYSRAFAKTRLEAIRNNAPAAVAALIIVLLLFKLTKTVIHLKRKRGI